MYEEDIIEQRPANEGKVHIVQSIRKLTADFLQTKLLVASLRPLSQLRLNVFYYQRHNNNNNKIIHS